MFQCSSFPELILMMIFLLVVNLATGIFYWIAYEYYQAMKYDHKKEIKYKILYINELHEKIEKLENNS